jgi:hypothetical protein
MGDQPYPKGTMTPAQEKAFVERQAEEANKRLELEKTIKNLKPNKPKTVKKAKGGKVSSGYKCSHNSLY